MIFYVSLKLCVTVQETGGIEQLCGVSMPSSEKAEMMLANFIIPLCLRIGGNEKGSSTLTVSCHRSVNVTS